MLELLARDYGERPVFKGRAEQGQVEVLATSSRSTWTIIVTLPDDTACVIGAGTDLTLLPRPNPAPPDTRAGRESNPARP